MELSLFTFHGDRSFLARIPVGVKLAVLVPALTAVFSLGLRPVAILILFLAVVSWAAGFSLLSQLKDLRPVLVYLLFYYLAAVLANLLGEEQLAPTVLVPSPTTLLSMVRLLATLQLTSLLYKTTTSLQLKYCLEGAETAGRTFLRKLPKAEKKIGTEPKITRTLTLVITFIPRLMSLWNQLELAWRARGGTSGLPMLKSLLPQLLLLSFTDAENTWQAVANRED